MVEGVAGFELVAVGFGDKGGEPLGDGVEVGLDGGAKSFGGGLVVGAEAVEAGVEGMTESIDTVGDFGAEEGEVGAAGAGDLGAGAGGVLGGVGSAGRASRTCVRRGSCASDAGLRRSRKRTARRVAAVRAMRIGSIFVFPSPQRITRIG